MQPRFSLEYFDPPEALAHHVMVLFHFATDEPVIHDTQPGGLGQLVLFAQGEGEMHFAGHTDPVRGKAYLMSGFSRAARFEMRGPWRTIGASLSPLGWAALTGTPARDHVDRFLPASQLVGGDVEHFAGQLGAQYLAGQLGGEAACNALADWIALRLGQIPAVHERLIETTIHWLGGAIFPDLELLFPQLPYSRRQSERLVERYFGLPPAALARKFRAIRAAAPDAARALYLHFAEALRGLGIATETGRFGAEMSVALVNDGPVTIWIES